MGLLISLIAGSGMGLVLLLATRLLYKRPELGIILVLLNFICEAIAISLPGLQLGVFLIYPQDFIFFILALVGIARFIFQGKVTSLNLGWLLFGILIFISFIEGVLIYGPQIPAVEFRQYFYFWAGTFYFMSISYEAISVIRWPKLWISTAIVLLLIAIVRWTTDILGITSWYVTIGVTPFRVLSSAQTFFLAEAFGILLLTSLRQRLLFWQSVLLPTVGLAILILQHRTIWVVTAILITLIFLNFSKATSKQAISVLVFAVFLYLFILATAPEQASEVFLSLNKSSETGVNLEAGTFAARTESWRVLLADVNTLREYLFGNPFGSGYGRFLTNSNNKLIFVEFAPHNYFVQTFLRVGIFGLAILLFIYILRILPFRMHTNLDKQVLFEDNILWIFTVMQLVYNITYTPNFEQSIIAGFALSYWQLRFSTVEQKNQFKKLELR